MSKHLVMACALSALAFSCGKKSDASAEEASVPKVQFDRSEPAPEQRKPVEGADLSGLSEDKKNRFERLANSLPSPCGKPHSLRTSRNTDKNCRRAPFAVKLVIELLRDEGTNKQIRDYYDRHYRNAERAKKRKFDLVGRPFAGSESGQVEIVEFFDYGCGACVRFKPELDKTIETFGNRAVVFYKQFPLPGHQPGSGVAAQAALAVFKLKPDKFADYHAWLFKNRGKHKRADVEAQAKTYGISAAAFDKAYKEAAKTVGADQLDGQRDRAVEATPTVYVNGYKYEGPTISKYLNLFIEETLAVGQ